MASMSGRAAAADVVTACEAEPSLFEAEISEQCGGGEGLTFADALHGWTFNNAGLWATTDGGTDWQYQPLIGPVPGYGPSPALESPFRR